MKQYRHQQSFNTFEKLLVGITSLQMTSFVANSSKNFV